MATYYINKLTGNDAWDGTSEVYVSGTTGPWKTPNKALQTAYVSASTHTIEVARGSGPYMRSDFTYAGMGCFYPQQKNGANITWNWNDNAIQMDFNVNTSTYKWTKSNASGKTDWYYLTLADGTNPALETVHSCIINNYGSCDSTSLNSTFPVYGHYATDNFAWGDYDTLGYSTLYVRYNNGQDPTGGNPIYPAQHVRCVKIDAGTSIFTFNDCIFRGGNIDLVQTGVKTYFNRCLFYNADQHGLRFNGTSASGTIVSNCIFFNCGHRGVYNDAYAVDFEVYNCDFINVHLMLLIGYAGTYTVTFKNNSSYNLLAGGIQFDVVGPTLIESNNQFHIDPNSTHTGEAIAYTTGSRKWTVTAASDLPSSTNTNIDTGIDPLYVSEFDFKLKSSSPCINAGTTIEGLATDYDGKKVPYSTAPDIGAYEYRPTVGPFRW